MFGIFYGLTILAAGETRDGEVLAIPVLGPVLYQDKSSCERSLYGTNCSESRTSGVRLFDTLGQATGAALIVSAYAFPQRVLVLTDPYTTGWTVTPTLGRSGGGLSAIGRF